MVIARGSTLMGLPGVGPVVAARTLADVGDVARFADRNRFASGTGTAPLDASSGEQIRHRLPRILRRCTLPFAYWRAIHTPSASGGTVHITPVGPPT
jgi:transposase